MNRNILAGILGVLLALSIGGNVWLYISGDKNKKALADMASVKLLNDSLQMQVNTLDSIQNLLALTQSDNSKLAVRVDELESSGVTPDQVADLRKKLSYYKSLAASSGSAYASAAGGTLSSKDAAKLSDLKKELEARIAEIKALNEKIAALVEERDGAIADRDAAVKRKENLEADNADMKDRIGKSAFPQYSSLITKGIDTKSKNSEFTDKAKNVHRFSVQFDILENALVNSDMTEEVTIRIIGPEGEVLSTTNEKLTRKNEVYSLKKEIRFDGQPHSEKWSFPESGNLDVKLKKGRYTTQLWSRNLMKLTNNFDLK